MSNNPLFSVIVLTRDRPRLLVRALSSIYTQTFKGSIDLIVHDDGSANSTREAIKRFLDEFAHPRITCFVSRSPTPLGPARAKNSLLPHCKGRWIAFLDDDDWYGTDHLNDLSRFLVYAPLDLDMVHTKATVIGSPYITHQVTGCGKVHVDDPSVKLGATFVLRNARVCESLQQAKEPLFPEQNYAHDYAFFKKAQDVLNWTILGLPFRSYFYDRVSSETSITKTQARSSLETSSSGSSSGSSPTKL
jgi:glycosyltransferase involved in cell wall biosynthesis